MRPRLPPHAGPVDQLALPSIASIDSRRPTRGLAGTYSQTVSAVQRHLGDPPSTSSQLVAVVDHGRE